MAFSLAVSFAGHVDATGMPVSDAMPAMKVMVDRDALW
jgi:hypothetical protein